MQSRAGFFACRFFIGLFMGGFIPVSCDDGRLFERTDSK